MATADQLVELMFSWIEQWENCAKKLKKLADELETLRMNCNAAECVGSKTVAGAATLIGAGVATFCTGGAAAPLALAGGVLGGAGVAVSVTAKIIEHFSSSDTLKDAEEIEDKNNAIAEIIQNLFEQLKAEVKTMYPSADPDQVDRHVMTSFMRAVARGSGLKLNFNSSQHESFYPTRRGIRQNSLNNSAVAAGLTAVCGIFKMFSLKTAGKMSAAGLKTGDQALIVEGAVKMGFALPEVIDNWTDLIKKNHETEASRSMRDTADNILKNCSTLRSEFDNMRTDLEEMDRRQREEEEWARKRREEEEDRRRREEGEDRKRREEEEARKQREEEEDRRRREEEMDRRQREEEEWARKRREEEEARKRREEEKDRRRREEEDRRRRLVLLVVGLLICLVFSYYRRNIMSSDPVQEKSVNLMTQSDQRHVIEHCDQSEQTGGEQEKNSQQTEGEQNINSQQAEQTGGDQGDDERDDEDKERDQCEIYQTPPGTIRIGLFNAQSMNDKEFLISELIEQNHLDVFLTTETWLTDDTAVRVLREASPEGFRFHSQVRADGRRGGGVANQFSEELQGEPIHFNYLNIETFEFVVTKLQRDDWDQPVVIINLYHPPGYNQQQFRRFLNEFQSLLDEVKKNYSSFIVTGDFNIHVNNERRSFTDEFYHVWQHYNLTQHVDEPTRGKNPLDLVLTTNVEISGLFVQHDTDSDHYTVYFNAKPKDTREKTEENENKEQKRFRQSEE